MLVGIIGAMARETDAIMARMTNAETRMECGIRFCRGTLDGVQAVTAQCGIGKVFAAMCATVMIERYRPNLILNIGVAGALDGSGLGYTHEYKLGPRNRIDFLVGRIGIEVKKGRPASSRLVGQLRRYLESDALDGMIVVTQRVTALPATINGKPVKLITLNRLWGVALP
jgi:hypothetical protein